MISIDAVLFRLFPGSSPGNIKSILLAFAQQESNVTFIQVGAHDGRSGDLIHDFVINNPWRGIFIEPVPYLFERLVLNYKNFSDRFSFENVAIDTVDGVKKFYAIREADGNSVPGWHTQLGSFDKNNILKHAGSIPGLQELIYVIDVRTMTMKSLLEKNKMTNPQIIAIDTEGYDGVVVSSLLREGIRPQILIFEHKHLSWWTYKTCTRKLKELGYSVYKDGGNSIAVRQNE